MKKIIVAIFALPFFISCSGILNKEPISSLNSELFWQTDGDLASAKAAMYQSFASAMTRGYYDWGEVRGGNYDIYQSASKVQELMSNNIPPENSACLWSDLYKTINKAALIIKYAPRTSNASSDNIRAALGEAHAMRALSYFYAVRVWGDVPLYKEAIERYKVETCRKGRTSAEVVLDFIEEDIAAAEEYFPSVSSSVVRVQANLGMLLALKADVAAWRHKYADVIDIYENRIAKLPSAAFAFLSFRADDVTEEWIDKWRSIVQEGTEAKEVYFMVHYDKLVDGTTNYTRTYFCSNGEMLKVSPETLSCFESMDIRKEGTFAESSGNLLKLEKFWPRGNAKINDYYSDNDLIMYRVTDIQLLYAEALNEQDRGTDAMKIINNIRSRAGASALDVTQKDEIRNAVLMERKLELLGEGKYWFDLVRLGMTESEGVCPKNKILFPIATSHLLENPLLTQNQ